MIRPLCVVLILFLILGCVGHYHFVVELNASNFDIEIRSAGFVFVEFYHGHHNPELDDAARLLKDFSIAAVNCQDTKNQVLVDKYHITSFPTYKLFRDGIDKTFKTTPAFSDNNNNNSSSSNTVPNAKEIVYFCLDALDQYLDRKALASSAVAKDIFHMSDDDSALIHLRSISEVEAFRELEDIATIAFFTDETDPRLRVYTYAAENNNDGLAFGVVHAESLFDRLGASEGEVQLYQDGLLYASTHVTDNPTLLLDWIADTSFRPLRELSDRNVERRLFDGLPAVVAFVPTNSTFDFATFRKIATEFRRKLSFLFAYPSEELEVVMTSLGVSPDRLPTIVLFDPTTEDKYLFADEPKLSSITINNQQSPSSDAVLGSMLRRFCSDFLEHSLSPTLRSAAIPEGGEFVRENFVNVVVGDTLWKTVTSGKDVVLLVYTSWCPHSQKLLPVFESLAETLNSASDVIVLAKINADENDLPRTFAVQAVPTVMFIPASSSSNAPKPLVFDGPRTHIALSHFVTKHSKNGNRLMALLGKKEL